MYDLSSKFNTFYRDYVVLPGDKQQDLRDKKTLNIDRLKSGLAAYNDANDTDYKVAETRVQGSVAMHTVVQNDENDYDIDVAIIFDKENLNGATAIGARRLVRDALQLKAGQFKYTPDLKTNCVRIRYSDGYHVDFAVYRSYKEDGSDEYKYEHAGGNDWSPRDPAAITAWFTAEDKETDWELKKIVRLSKMFCKSHGWKNMPGGLIQSVVIDEKYSSDYDRIDERFYYTMAAVRDRLKISTEVYNPTDPDLSLNTATNHYEKMDKWLNRLDSKLADLDVLFNDGCSYHEAVNAWNKFFDHKYWSDLINELAFVTKSEHRNTYSFTNTEESIEDQEIGINEQYSASIRCEVSRNGFRKTELNEFLDKYKKFKWLLPHGLEIDFYASTDAPKPYDVWWKIRNVGLEAERRNRIRGQIEKKYGTHKHEESQFRGPHFVECYIIKNGQCVASCRKYVPIGDDSI